MLQRRDGRHGPSHEGQQLRFAGAGFEAGQQHIGIK